MAPGRPRPGWPAPGVAGARDGRRRPNNAKLRKCRAGAYWYASRMHEMSIAESILGIIEDSARREGFRSVRAVRVEIGELAGVEIEALRFCFEASTRDGLAAGARLDVVRTPGSAWCGGCGNSVPVHSRLDPCPRCGQFGLQIRGGTDMRVSDLEVS